MSPPRWVGQSVERVEDAALLTGQRPLHRRPRHQARHAACRDPALPARPCRDHLDRRERRHRATRRRPRHHRSRSRRHHLRAGRERAGRGRCEAHRIKPGPLCRRAGRGRAGIGPLCRRGRGRPHRRVLSPAARRGRSGRGTRSRSAGAAREGRQQSAERTPFHLRRSRPGLRLRTASDHPSLAAIRATADRRWKPYGVVAEYDPHADAYDVLANFQGPFSIHAVIARALKVPGNRLRLRLPPIPAAASA